MPTTALMTGGERTFVERLSKLATTNPFLPERVELERRALGRDFEAVSPVWSKRLGRENPNVVKLAAKAEAAARSIREKLASKRHGTLDGEDARLYDDLVLYVLYYRFEEEFERAMSTSTVGFYGKFAEQAHWFFSPAGKSRAFDDELRHWFAFLFQIRRASYHVFEFIVGSSLPAAKLRAAVWQSIFTHDLRRYRRSLYAKMNDVASLVIGPSGTGKELVARAIGLSGYIPYQERSKRFALKLEETFLPLNLSALAPTLIESELFGHRRGAFTGALSDRKGWLSLCPALGTVFLDEIGDLDPALQVKLLRVLQSREFQPIGETGTDRFQGRIVAATNRDLPREMRSRRFREDLYYRLCSDLIRTPSLQEQLRDAPEDLDELVSFIAERIAGAEEAEAITKEVVAWIRSALGADYGWPGNVRELEQCVRNVIVRREYHPPAAGTAPDHPPWLVDLRTARWSAEELVERYCAIVYDRTGSYLETARRLGLDRRTVKAKIERHHGRGARGGSV